MEPVYFCRSQNIPKLERCKDCQCTPVYRATDKAWRGQKKKVITHLDNLLERNPQRADIELPELKRVLKVIDDRIIMNEEPVSSK